MSRSGSLNKAETSGKHPILRILDRKFSKLCHRDTPRDTKHEFETKHVLEKPGTNSNLESGKGVELFRFLRA
jgi:hypothetical protein